VSFGAVPAAASFASTPVSVTEPDILWLIPVALLAIWLRRLYDWRK
jgi:hypothetical protein